VNCRPRYGDSSQAAQDTFTEARDDAVQTYGEGEQADMAAFASLKKQFEKCGDHWIARPAPAG
jgi:ChaB